MTPLEHLYTDMVWQNLDDIGRLQYDIEYWETIYQKRVFDGKWPKDIQEIMDEIRSEIKKELEQCKYYLKRLKEVRSDDEQSRKAQSGKDQDNAFKQGARAGDTPKDTTPTQSEDLGVTPEETDHNRSENV